MKSLKEFEQPDEAAAADSAAIDGYVKEKEDEMTAQIQRIQSFFDEQIQDRIVVIHQKQQEIMSDDDEYS